MKRCSEVNTELEAMSVNVSNTHDEHDDVEVVGELAKVAALVLHDLERLLHDVEEEEADEDELAGEDEVVEGVDVPEGPFDRKILSLNLSLKNWQLSKAIHTNQNYKDEVYSSPMPINPSV